MSVERVKEVSFAIDTSATQALTCICQYIDLPTEKYEGIRGAPSTWPDEGSIEFKEFGARYRPGLDLALRDLSLNVAPREKIGIVGRTGAGKSSMTLSLFRIIEAAKGSITIDDVNIASLGLFDLRYA